MELEELGRLMSVEPSSILNRRIEALGATEYQVVQDALAGMRKIILANRDIDLPGLTRQATLVTQVLAEFKEKKKRNVMPLQYAKTDDIVIEPLRPEQFSAGSTPTVLDNWLQTSLSVAEHNLLPNEAQVSDGATKIEVDDDEVFVITDFIEHQPTARATAIQAEIDGTKYQPLDMRIAMKQSDLKMFELDYPWIADVSMDIDMKVESAGDVELTPYGVHICLGKLIADIT